MAWPAVREGVPRLDGASALGRGGGGSSAALAVGGRHARGIAGTVGRTRTKRGELGRRSATRNAPLSRSTQRRRMSTGQTRTEPPNRALSLAIPTEVAAGLRSGIGAELQLLATLGAQGMNGQPCELSLECDQPVIDPTGSIRSLEIDGDRWKEEVVVTFTTTAATTGSARVGLRVQAGGLSQFAGCSLDVVGCCATPTVAQDLVDREDDNTGGK
jgi:hypothetical protein